jgi:hypothetical protein
LLCGRRVKYLTSCINILTYLSTKY